MTPKDPVDLVREDLRELRGVIRSELRALRVDLEQVKTEVAVLRSSDKEKKRLSAVWTPAIVSALVASLLAFIKH